MGAYLVEVRKMEKQFLGLELQHAPRGMNKEADDIARRASKRLPQEPGVFEERLFKPSVATQYAGLASSREEPLRVARPLELACSWHSSLGRGAGERGGRGAHGPTGYGIQHTGW